MLMEASVPREPGVRCIWPSRGEVFPPDAESGEDGPGRSAGSWTPDSSGSSHTPRGSQAHRVEPSRARWANASLAVFHEVRLGVSELDLVGGADAGEEGAVAGGRKELRGGFAREEDPALGHPDLPAHALLGADRHVGSRAIGLSSKPWIHDAPRSAGRPRSCEVQMRPPMRSRASRIATSYPSTARSRAAVNPAMPAPITRTSRDWTLMPPFMPEMAPARERLATTSGSEG